MRRSLLALCCLITLSSYPVVAQIPEQKSSGPQSGPNPAKLHSQTAQRAPIVASQIRHTMRDKVNTGLVGIVSGSMDGTDLGGATDLAVSLDKAGQNLRVVPVVGKGGFQNVTDIIFARGIDIGIIQTDVLEALKHDPPFPGIENYLQYITKLYDEEVHILAGKDVNSIDDLASKKVNLGMPESGTYMTANVVFQKLGISVEATSFPLPVALEKLRRGEISALVSVVGKPARFFQNIRPDENLHFLSIAPSDDLRETYSPASLTADDYPDLIDAGKPVSTVAVGSVLAVYNWPTGVDRHRKVAQFVRAFLDSLHDLQAPPHHPKWREVDVAAQVPGWTRFAEAQQWVRKAELGRTTGNLALREPVTDRQPTALSSAERNALFADFVGYQQRQAREVNGAGLLDPRQRDALFADFVAYQHRQVHALNTTGWLDPPQRHVTLFSAAAN